MISRNFVILNRHRVPNFILVRAITRNSNFKCESVISKSSSPCIRYLGYRRGNRDKSRTCRYVVFLTVTAKVDSRVLDVLYYLVTITVVSLCNGVFDTSNVYCLLLYYWRGDSGGISSIPEPYKPEVNILYAAQTLHC